MFINWSVHCMSNLYLALVDENENENENENKNEIKMK